MRISRKDALQFKKFLHQLKQANFLAVPEKVGMKSKPRTLYGTLKKIWGEVEELNQSGHAVFMGVNETKGEGRTSSNVAKVTALVADYDGGEWSVKDLKKFLKKFEVKPDMVNETSPGNFHVYWLVKDVPLDKFKPVQQLLAMHYGTDEKVCDLSRAMRMPGTINWKHDEPFLVRTVYVNDDAKPVSLKKFFLSTFGALAWEGFSSSYSPNSVAVAVVAADSSKGDVARVVKALAPIPADDRQLWVTVGMALKNEFGDSGLQMFKDWSAKSPKYDEQELERQWKSFKPASDKSGGITIGTVFWLSKIYAEMNDLNGENTVWPSSLLELSERFADASTHMLKHCEQDNAFYTFRNGRWQRSRHSAERVGIEFLMAMKAAASKSGNEKVQDFLDKHQTHGSARELLRAAQSNTLLAVAPNAFDKVENVLGVKLPAVEGAIDRHAVVDLLKKTFRLAKPGDMLLRIAGAEYDRSARCPLWVDFIDAVTEGDTDLADFLQLAVGYTLYGHAKEQVLFILIGSGGNGKGVFSRIVFALLGDYSAILQNNLLKPGAINANSPSPALMKLMGKRLWVCSEVPKGMVLDEALTKQITGGDLVSTRHLYGDQVEYQPIGKLWLSVNDMPKVRHDDKGMWRRIVAIPFNAVFTGKDRDNDLEEKLKAELPGILNWALAGARKYAELGKLGRPSASKKLLAALRRDVDTVGTWIKNRCSITDDGNIPAQIAYDDYCDAMKREKANPISQKDFKADLVRRGFKHKASHDRNYFLGIAIKEG